MPNSLLIVAQFKVTPADADERGLDSDLIKETVTLTGIISQGPITIEIGTSEETIAIPTDIGVDGHLLMRNIDDNTVEWGVVTAVYPFQIQTGEPQIVQFKNETQLFMIALTAAARIEFSWVKK